MAKAHFVLSFLDIVFNIPRSGAESHNVEWVKNHQDGLAISQIFLLYRIKHKEYLSFGTKIFSHS